MKQQSIFGSLIEPPPIEAPLACDYKKTYAVLHNMSTGVVKQLPLELAKPCGALGSQLLHQTVAACMTAASVSACAPVLKRAA